MIIAFTGQKGGAGKSTAAVCVAAAASRRRRVLIVDADPQGTARTWAEVAAEAGRQAPTVIAMGNSMHRPDQLPRVRRGFDWVVIDCPPRADNIQRSALMVTDLAVLPCGPTAADAWALAGTLELVQEAQVVRPSLRAVVLLTRIQGTTTVGRGAREVLRDCGQGVLGTELGYRVAYQEALAAGLGVTDYAPSSPAAREIGALMNELNSMQPRPQSRSRNGKKTRRAVT